MRTAQKQSQRRREVEREDEAVEQAKPDLTVIDELLETIDQALAEELELDAADLLLKAEGLGFKQAVGTYCADGAVCGNTAIMLLRS